MQESKEKARKITWITLVTVYLILIIAIAIVLVALSYKKELSVSSNGDMLTKNEENENSISIETLTEVSNKTEEELKEINEKELEEAQKNEKNNQKPKKNKYYIKVNYGAQVVNVYTYDKNGNYTVPVKAFVCSTGTETPRSGVYRIPAKIEWCHMYGDVWAHYCTQIVGNILFHSVPYLERNNHSLEYWAYDKLGTKASMGCIRLTTRDAKWIYNNVSTGTQIEFYSSSNPGPLGKPSAQKVSNAPGDLKWWDPTDPDPNNPWKSYKPEKNNNNTNSEQNNVTGSEVTNTENSNVTDNSVIENNTQNTVENNEQSNQTDNTVDNNEQANTTDNTVGNNEQANNTDNTVQSNNIENNSANEEANSNERNEISVN